MTEKEKEHDFFQKHVYNRDSLYLYIWGQFYANISFQLLILSTEYV